MGDMADFYNYSFYWDEEWEDEWQPWQLRLEVELRNEARKEAQAIEEMKKLWAKKQT